MQTAHEDIENRQSRAEFNMVNVPRLGKQFRVFQKFRGDIRCIVCLCDVYAGSFPGNLVTVAVDERDIPLLIHKKVGRIEVIDQDLF